VQAVVRVYCVNKRVRYQSLSAVIIRSKSTIVNILNTSKHKLMLAVFYFIRCLKRKLKICVYENTETLSSWK